MYIAKKSSGFTKVQKQLMIWVHFSLLQRDHWKFTHSWILNCVSLDHSVPEQSNHSLLVFEDVFTIPEKLQIN